MGYIYWLPDEQNVKIEYETNINSLFIIGANGSGKSKLGAWIEKQDFEKVHRIGAQRSLNFKENIPLKNFQNATEFLMYGSDDKSHYYNKVYRWDWGKAYTTKLIEDFEYVLAAFIAKKNLENDAYILACKNAEIKGETYPSVPITIIDKLTTIWDAIFPQRILKIEDSKFYGIFNKNGQEVKYCANQMSDGERSVLYLAAQVLCLPEDKVIIMDEPEIHLHRSLMSRLWNELEKARPDCFFIYITHDTQFAASHRLSDKFWVKSFDGKNWQIQKIEKNELPEKLLLDILGNRKNVLFVEGNENSYDTQLYSILYPDYYVIPCGSCEQVIMRTKAFKNNANLHHLSICGIIDRDFRSDYELNKYKQQGIYPLEVAEVENLFIIEELLEKVVERFECEQNSIEKVKDFIINTKFANQLHQQVYLNVIKEVKFKLSEYTIEGKNETEIQDCINKLQNGIKLNKIKDEIEAKYKKTLNDKNYSEVLKLFNSKDLAKNIGVFFGVNNNEYFSKILSLVSKNSEEYIKLFKKYLPKDLP